MKRAFFTLSALIGLMVTLNAQTLPEYQWARRAGGINIDQGLSVAVDALGNTFVTGTFRGTATFGNEQVSTQGNEDLYVAKYDSLGALLWVRATGSGGNDAGLGVATDADGNCYATGFFRGTIALGDTSLTTQGNEDIYLVKFDPEGAVLWARRAGGTGEDAGRAVAVDPDGNCLLAGSFRGTAVFADTLFNTAGSSDIVLAKYSSEGTLLWARQAGGGGSDVATAVATDAAGRAYLTGSFQGEANFAGDTVTTQGLDDIFLARYTPEGVFLGVTAFGGAGDDHGRAVATTTDGNVWVAGDFRGAVTFGDSTISTQGNEDVFVLRLNGEQVAWVRAFGAGGTDVAYGLAVDAVGNSYLTGEFQGTIAIADTTLVTNGSVDAWLAQYSPFGALRYARNTGSVFDDGGRAVAIDPGGDLRMTGFFRGTVGFGGDTLSSSDADVFVARVREGVISALSPLRARPLAVYPNPSAGQFRLVLPHAAATHLRVYDAQGREVFALTEMSGIRRVVLPPMAPGVYLLRARHKDRHYKGRIVIE